MEQAVLDMPVEREMIESEEEERKYPLRLVIITAVCLFIAEALAMALLHLIPQYSPLIEGLIDASLLTVISVGLLYHYLYQPMVGEIHERNRAEAALRKSHDELEQRVRDATAELMTTNVFLTCEVNDRHQAEKFLRESEERLTRIVETITDGIYIVDRNGKITFANAEAERIFGMSRDQLYNMTYDDSRWKVTKPSGQPFAPEEYPFARVMKTGAPVHGVELVSERLDGSRVIVSINAAPLRDASGAILGMVATQSDVTEKKTLESQLTQAQKLESIGQLAAGIAHEINTPIQYVGDNIRFFEDAFREFKPFLTLWKSFDNDSGSGGDPRDLVSEMREKAKDVDMEYLTTEVPKAITQSLEGVSRVAEIVRAMKEFSHPGNVEKTAVDINRAIQSTILVSKNEWKYAADMVTDLEPALPYVSCVAAEFNQVILNLIVNASHAIKDVVGDGSKGKGTIKISSRKNGEFVEIRVEDTGSGIPENIRHRVFDPFFTTKDVGKGTGQGLAIAHSVIVDKHGGTITFDTEAGKGTVFIIRLPLVFE